MDNFVAIKDLQKGTPSKTQSLVHDGDEGTKRIEFAELLSAVLKTADYSADTPIKTDSVVVEGAGGAKKIAFSDLLATIIGASNINTAGFHNSIYRGKDITEYFNDGTLYKRIAGTDGFAPFEDLYVGDYFKMSAKVSAPGTTSGTDIVKIAGFNLHWNNYNTADMRVPHVDLVPATHFGTSGMNSSATTAGGYIGSKMFTDVIGKPATAGKADGTINEQLFNIFGSHLKTFKEYLTNTVDEARYNRIGQASGASSAATWSDVQAVLMNEVEVYGSVAWGSSGYDVGSGKAQLPIFRHSVADMIIPDVYYWLRDVASAPFFCFVYYIGLAYDGPAYLGNYVRPRFTIA